MSEKEKESILEQELQRSIDTLEKYNSFTGWYRMNTVMQILFKQVADSMEEPDTEPPVEHDDSDMMNKFIMSRLPIVFPDLPDLFHKEGKMEHLAREFGKWLAREWPTTYRKVQRHALEHMADRARTGEREARTLLAKRYPTVVQSWVSKAGPYIEPKVKSKDKPEKPLVLEKAYRAAGGATKHKTELPRVASYPHSRQPERGSISQHVSSRQYVQLQPVQKLGSSSQHTAASSASEQLSKEFAEQLRRQYALAEQVGPSNQHASSFDHTKQSVVQPEQLASSSSKHAAVASASEQLSQQFAEQIRKQYATAEPSKQSVQPQLASSSPQSPRRTGLVLSPPSKQRVHFAEHVTSSQARASSNLPLGSREHVTSIHVVSREHVTPPKRVMSGSQQAASQQTNKKENHQNVAVPVLGLHLSTVQEKERKVRKAAPLMSWEEYERKASHARRSSLVAVAKDIMAAEQDILAIAGGIAAIKGDISAVGQAGSKLASSSQSTRERKVASERAIQPAVMSQPSGRKYESRTTNPYAAVAIAPPDPSRRDKLKLTGYPHAPAAYPPRLQLSEYRLPQADSTQLAGLQAMRHQLASKQKNKEKTSSFPQQQQREAKQPVVLNFKYQHLVSQQGAAPWPHKAAGKRVGLVQQNAPLPSSTVRSA
eukprot:g77059.t1